MFNFNADQIAQFIINMIEIIVHSLAYVGSAVVITMMVLAVASHIDDTMKAKKRKAFEFAQAHSRTYAQSRLAYTNSNEERKMLKYILRTNPWGYLK